jgi:large subunit ribosomal protein L9
MHVKVLLIREVPGLGIPGDVVDVKDGHARNYLFPQKLAVPPTAHAMARFAKLRAQYKMELADRRTRAQALAEKLLGAEFVFLRRVHDEDKLYAAVRPADLARAIEERFGEKIDPDRIRMGAVEALGEYPAEITLYEDITATVTVKVEVAA